MKLLLASSFAALASFVAGSLASAQLDVTPQPSASQVPRYLPFELRLFHSRPYPNPFWDVSVSANFLSPGGASYPLEGFYYDTGVWMVRFAPVIEGLWSYEMTMSAGGASYQTSGAFLCTPSELHGPLRVDPDNPERLVRDDGTPFFAIGTNHFTFEHPAINGLWIGDESTSLGQRWAQYFETYHLHGGNTWRRQLETEFPWDFEQHRIPGMRPFDGGNGIWCDSGVDQYSLPRARVFDVELREARAHDMAVILVLLNKQMKWETNPLNACNGGPFPPPIGLNGQPDCNADRGHPADLFDVENGVSLGYHRRYFRYLVARYAAFVDVWELFNEFDEADHDGNARRMGLRPQWKESMARFVRSKTPYPGLVCSTRVDPGPVLDAWQDLSVSHSYTTQPANVVCDSGNHCADFDPTACARSVDAVLAAIPRRPGKPDLIDEFGFKNNIPNDDPAHHRVGIWTALHRDSGLVFWDANGRADCARLEQEPCGSVRVSAYLSDATRTLFGICQAYAAKLPSSIKAAPANPHILFPEQGVRAFALADKPLGVYSAYFHDFASHTRVRSGALVTVVDLKNENHEALWFNPKTGGTVASFGFAGPQLTSATIPDFLQDIALLIRPAAPVAILTPAIPAAPRGEPFFFRLKARGGGMPYSWSLASGALPSGMVLNDSGVLSGTPRFGGSNRFTVEVNARALATGGGVSSDRATYTIQWAESFASDGARDGVVVESAEGTLQGGSVYPSRTDAFGLAVGDDGANRRGVTFVSFDTSALPDNAVIDAAEVHLNSSESAGAIGSFLPLYLDVKTGAFGPTPALEAADFRAPATVARTASLAQFQPGAGTQELVLAFDANGTSAVNRAGLTQCRIYFLAGTDRDHRIDGIGFCPGEHAQAALRPELVLRYH
jgi:hypothetical protein